jgi:hypothetical protein
MYYYPTVPTVVNELDVNGLLVIIANFFTMWLSVPVVLTWC